MTYATPARAFRRTRPLPGILLSLAAAALSACAVRGPIVGGEKTADAASGTISGSVRAAGSSTPLPSRRVTAINTSTNAKYEASTNSAGGYTIQVPTGVYRLQVELRENEVIAEGPGELNVSRSDVDADRDFVIAVKPPGGMTSSS